MGPRTIHRQLARLRWRERGLRLAWAATLWLSLAALALTIACTVDYLIDRRQDTPLVLRYGMFLAQVGLWGATALIFGAWVFFRRLSDDDLALHVEQQLPQFSDRLISALQLNRAGADTKGMSPELIAAVTRQAEEQAAKVSFTDLADHRHLKRTMWLAVPLLLAVLLMLTLWSETLTALVARQFLADVDIPRSVIIENASREVWPTGEEVVLRFRVTGRGVDGASQGTVRTTPQQLVDVNQAGIRELTRVPNINGDLAQQIVAGRAKQPYQTIDDLQRAGIEALTITAIRPYLCVGPQLSEDYPLERESASVYLARIPPGTTSFSFRAWLGDGRTRQPGQVRYEPRPSITRQDAWVVLPEYAGLRPSGKPYELYQAKADISGLLGSAARLQVEVQKPVQKAVLELFGSAEPADPLQALLIRAAGQGNAKEVLTRRIPLELRGHGTTAQGTFDLRPGETTYRVVVEDEYGFVNLDPPRRRVEIVPEPPPLVELLPERFPGLDSIGFTEEDDVAGIPILLGSKVRIGYSARHPYGLGKATLVYRLNEGEWWRLPLTEVPADPAKGPFDIRRGLFQKSQANERVEFHPTPSPDPEALLGRTLGGGQLDFETAKLPGIKSGDRLEYFVEVSSRNPGLADQPGQSEIRLKTVVPEAEFLAWMRTTLQQETRLRQLEARQRGVFTAGKSGEDDTKTIDRSKPPAVPSNFVREWQLIGPFPSVNGDGHARAWPPQSEKAELGKEYDNGTGKVGWRLHRSTTDKIDLERALGESKPSVGYALCWLHSDERQLAQLSLGFGQDIKVYVNRAKLVDRVGSKQAEPGQHTASLYLLEGWNEVLVKVHGQGGNWAFYLEVVDPQTKRPSPGISFRTSSPEDEVNKFVRHWQLLGPLPNPEQGRDLEYPAEKEPVDEKADYDGIDGKIHWRKYKSHSNKIDLARFFDRPFQERNLAYAVCWVEAKEARPAVIATGSDDGIKVWLNRELKIDKAGQREALPGSDAAKIELREGWNEILVKVDNHFGRWGFYLELRDAETGRPLDNVAFRTEPPKKPK